MYPAAFDYHRPKSLEDALRILQDKPEAKPLAGGHSLIPLMKQRLARPKHLVDLRYLDELKGIRVEGGALVIGAMTRHREVQASSVVGAECPALREVAACIGDPQVRNCGTIGGSLVHADPGADYPAIVLALDAELVCKGPGGRRTVKATHWFQALLTTDLKEDEILIEIRFPVPAAPWGAAYIKLPDPASRLAMVGIAAAVGVREGGLCSWIGIGVTGAGSVPARAPSAEGALAGKAFEDNRITAAAHDLARDIRPDLRRLRAAEDHEHLCAVLAERAIRLAAERAGVEFAAH